MVAPLFTTSTPEWALSALTTIPRGATGEPAGEAGAGTATTGVAKAKANITPKSLRINPPCKVNLKIRRSFE
jgi:hypothetical protein